jgi:hypothetical protein
VSAWSQLSVTEAVPQISGEKVGECYSIQLKAKWDPFGRPSWYNLEVVADLPVQHSKYGKSTSELMRRFGTAAPGWRQSFEQQSPAPKKMYRQVALVRPPMNEQQGF